MKLKWKNLSVEWRGFTCYADSSYWAIYLKETGKTVFSEVTRYGTEKHNQLMVENHLRMLESAFKRTSDQCWNMSNKRSK